LAAATFSGLMGAAAGLRRWPLPALRGGDLRVDSAMAGILRTGSVVLLSPDVLCMKKHDIAA
jgi:hypothetical protein